MIRFHKVTRLKESVFEIKSYNHEIDNSSFRIVLNKMQHICVCESGTYNTTSSRKTYMNGTCRGNMINFKSIYTQTRGSYRILNLVETERERERRNLFRPFLLRSQNFLKLQFLISIIIVTPCSFY